MEAKALLDGMLSSGMKLNSVTYCHLIHGFCKEGNLDEAMNSFKKMFGSGCQPDSDCYFPLVYFFCQSGDFETALQICKESMEKWKRVGFRIFSTMKSVVNGLASIPKVDEARELVGQMKEKFSKFADSWNEVEESLPK
ncbi:pentatricopeptide repeat 336 [Actinidia rufa]|uniref:Pentatricopeptide repeat 336 n=1 Tax=Actinidia rufa TaxID=165716 RepID=A0A7J0DAL2_9ERIC|nr:pentatricopeptide repeat 336 [Actinidia rufa]